MIDTLVTVLHSLGERVRVKDKDVSAAAPVMGELAAALSRSGVDDLRRLLASVAGVREQLEAEKGVYEQKPVDALTDADSHTFLNGAMWATSELFQARIDDLQAGQDAATGLSERSQLRALALDLLRSAATLTPSALAQAARDRGLAATPDRVSKALGDLLRDGQITTTSPAEGSDRRFRHFTLAPSDDDLGRRRTPSFV